MFFKIKNYIKKNTGYILRLDDVAENMNWSNFNEIEFWLNKLNIKPVLGVIPLNQDPELLKYPKLKLDFWNKVRKWKKKGWEIAMHGTHHVYDRICHKNEDFLGHGGNTEFCGHSLNNQSKKIKLGFAKFKLENISLRCFFAPNHTFDTNTLIALKNIEVDQILDGYGLIPYNEKNITFIPQLFYKTYTLPFGIQTFQIHLNYFDKYQLKNFISFLKANKNNFIDYNFALSRVNNSFFYRFLRFSSKAILKYKRIIA
jgi:predicted deacetylase